MLSIIRPSGVYPQSLGGNVIPRDIPLGAWQTQEVVNVASIVHTVPQAKTDLLIALQVRGLTAATSIGLTIQLNGQTTTGSYHNQELGAANGAASVPETTTFSFGAIAADQSVADYFSTVYLFFPFFRNVRQKVCIISGSVELAALNQRVYLGVHKRHVADTSPLIDPITLVTVLAVTGNVSGSSRMKVLN